MSRLTFLLGFVLTLCVPALSLAQDKDEPVRLVWKGFDDRLSKPYFQEIRMTVNQVVKVAGTETKQTQDLTFVYRLTPHTPNREEDWLATKEIVRAKMDMLIGAERIKHDTDEGPGASKFLNAWVGTRLRLTIDRRMQVKEITVLEPFVKKVVAANPAIEKFIETLLKEAMAQMVEPTIAPFPVEAVKIGSSWERSAKHITLGELGTCITHNTYTYEGKVDGLDKVGITSTVRFAPPRQGDGDLPFKIVKGNLRGRNGKGFALFDRDLGRFVRGEHSIEMQGEIVFAIDGKDTVVVFQQRRTMTFRTSADQPK